MIDPTKERNKIAVAFACFVLFFAGVFFMVFTIGNREAQKPTGPANEQAPLLSSDAQPIQTQPTPPLPEGNLTPDELEQARQMAAARKLEEAATQQ